MRFNPPPNWPPAPPGWVPDSTWMPDPSWPPPPPGWPLWIDGPEPAKRRALWIALAVVAVVVVIAGSVFAVLGVPGGRLGGHGANPSGKPDITQLNRDLLVDKAAFGDFDGVRRSGLGTSDPKASGMPGLSISPEQCADVFGSSKAATQSAFATVSKLDAGALQSMEVRLSITPERRDLRGYLANCKAFTVSLELAGRSLSMDAKLDPLDAPGAPPWSVASEMSSSGSPFPGLPLKMSIRTATISGYYRGVLVVASFNEVNPRGKDSGSVDATKVADLVTLFDAQVKNLETAP